MLGLHSKIIKDDDACIQTRNSLNKEGLFFAEVLKWLDDSRTGTPGICIITVIDKVNKMIE